MTTESDLGRTHPRVMLMVESDNGFGHFNIIDQIARQVIAQGGQAAVASGTFFHPGTVFDYGGAKQYHLPAVVWNDSKKCHVNPITQIPYNDESYYKDLRKGEVRKACEDFKPDIVVFELYPFMTLFRRYDVDAIKELYNSDAGRPVIASLSRDIIHSAAPKETVRIVNEELDYLLVRGDGKLQKLDECMPEFKDIRHPIEYLGNVVSEMPSREPMPDRERPVLVFSSGGYRASVDNAFFATVIQGRKYSTTFSRHKWIVVISNNCPEDDFRFYQRMAAEETPCGSIEIVRPFENDCFRQLMANSAAAVVRGSYNSTFELAQVKAPFVVISRSSGTDQEQYVRAQALERAGLALHLPYDQLPNPELLGKKLDEAGLVRATSTVHLDFDGSHRIAVRVNELGLKRYIESLCDSHEDVLSA